MRAEYCFAPGLGLAVQGDAATIAHFDSEYGAAFGTSEHGRPASKKLTVKRQKSNINRTAGEAGEGYFYISYRTPCGR